MLTAHFVAIRNAFVTPDYFILYHVDIKTMWWHWKLRKCQRTFDKEALTDLQRFQIILVFLSAQASSSPNMLRNSSPILCGPSLNHP